MTTIYIPKGEVHDPVTDEVTHYLSKGRIIKSRYTNKAINIQIKIPVGETKDDVFDDLISTLKERNLYDYSRGSHKVYLTVGEDPIIKTKDNEEFLEMMLKTGIDLVSSVLSLSPDQVEDLKQHCQDKMVESSEDAEDEDEDEDVEDDE
jgi:hypothetical protein